MLLLVQLVKPWHLRRPTAAKNFNEVGVVFTLTESSSVKF